MQTNKFNTIKKVKKNCNKNSKCEKYVSKCEKYVSKWEKYVSNHVIRKNALILCKKLLKLNTTMKNIKHYPLECILNRY